MQIDFHFCATFALCRCCGFSAQESQTIASACQFTDDCTDWGHFLKPDGAFHKVIFTQCPAHSAFFEKWQETVLRPFHFVYDDHSANIVTENNAAIMRLVDTTLGWAESSAPYGLYALGIALHALADTFAHQGFSPYHSESNVVDNLPLDPRDEDKLGEFQKHFLRKYRKLPPAVGHAEAFSCPDIPFIKWKYRTPTSTGWADAALEGVQVRRGIVERDNAPIAARAARAIAEYLAKSGNRRARKEPEEIGQAFSPDLFRSLNSMNEREQQWKEGLKNNTIPGFFSKDDLAFFEYRGRHWIYEAYCYHDNPSKRQKKGLLPGYARTHWWKFQEAARKIRNAMDIGKG